MTSRRLLNEHEWRLQHDPDYTAAYNRTLEGQLRQLARAADDLGRAISEASGLKRLVACIRAKKTNL